jgi:hypothetical protein
MDRRAFIIPRQQEIHTSCGEEECICEEESIVVNKVQHNIKTLHLFFIALLAFVCAVAFVMVENNKANTQLLLQIKTTAIPCSTFTTVDIVLKKHSAPSDNNSNCPHQLSTCFLLNNDSKRKRINHC